MRDEYLYNLPCHQYFQVGCSSMDYIHWYNSLLLPQTCWYLFQSEIMRLISYWLLPHWNPMFEKWLVSEKSIVRCKIHNSIYQLIKKTKWSHRNWRILFLNKCNKWTKRVIDNNRAIAIEISTNHFAEIKLKIYSWHNTTVEKRFAQQHIISTELIPQLRIYNG